MLCHLRFLAVLLLTLQRLTEEDGILLWAPCLHYPASYNLCGDLWMLCPHGFQALLRQKRLSLSTRRSSKVTNLRIIELHVMSFEIACSGVQSRCKKEGLCQGSLKHPFSSYARQAPGTIWRTPAS